MHENEGLPTELTEHTEAIFGDGLIEKCFRTAKVRKHFIGEKDMEVILVSAQK